MALLRSSIITVAVLLVAAQQAAAAPGPWIAGIATNYGSAYDFLSPFEPSYGTKEGSCGYGELDKTAHPFWSVAALSIKNQYFLGGPLKGCGQCFEIQCVNNATSEFKNRCYTGQTSNSIIVTITDSCPECPANHIDIQALSFARLAPMAIGRIDIRYRQVDCSPPADLKLSVLDGNSGSGFFKFTVQDVGGSGTVSSVQVRGPVDPAARTAGGGWITAEPTAEAEALKAKRRSGRKLAALATSAQKYGEVLENQYGAAWQIDQMPKTPLSFRLVNKGGAQELVAADVVTTQQLQQNVLLPLSVNFSPTAGSTLRTGAAAYGSGRYGNSTTFSCPKPTQFFDVEKGSNPTCRTCAGFKWNYDATLKCWPPLRNEAQKFLCGPTVVAATARDRGATSSCLDPSATTHVVFMRRPDAAPIAYTAANIQPDVHLRSRGKTILKASTYQLVSGGVQVTFKDPNRRVGALMKNVKNKVNGFYVEGRVQPGGTGATMCFTSSQGNTLPLC